MKPNKEDSIDLTLMVERRKKTSLPMAILALVVLQLVVVGVLLFLGIALTKLLIVSGITILVTTLLFMSGLIK